MRLRFATMTMTCGALLTAACSGNIGFESDGAGVGSALSGWVAFDVNPGGAGRRIALAAANGSCQRTLTSGAGQQKQPAFSADGKQLAFASDATGKFQIYTLELATQRETQRTMLPEGASYPSWSPDGHTIAFVTGDPEDNGNTRSAVMTIDTETSETKQVAAATRPPFTWSAFASNDLLLVGNDFTLIGIATVAATQYDVVPPNGRIPNPASPSPSPDGARYVFSDFCGGNKALYVARVDGTTGDTCANALPLAAYQDSLDAVSWGPNGYVAAETGLHDIVLVPDNGSAGIRQLVSTPSAERNPAFAPAGFAFDCSVN